MGNTLVVMPALLPPADLPLVGTIKAENTIRYNLMAARADGRQFRQGRQPKGRSV
jgi:hypothetical protein